MAVEIPLNLTALQATIFTNESSIFGAGNIAVAYQLRNLQSNNFLEFKLRLATIGTNIIPVNADHTERTTALVPEVWSAESSYLYFHFLIAFRDQIV